MATTIKVLTNETGEWFWHAQNDGNHKIVATSGESFSSRDAAAIAADSARSAIAGATIVIPDDDVAKSMDMLIRASARQMRLRS